MMRLPAVFKLEQALYHLSLGFIHIKVLLSDFWNFPHPWKPISNTTAWVHSLVMATSALTPSSMKQRKGTDRGRTLRSGRLRLNPTVHFVGQGSLGHLGTSFQASVWCCHLKITAVGGKSHRVFKEIRLFLHIVWIQHILTLF